MTRPGRTPQEADSRAIDDWRNRIKERKSKIPVVEIKPTFKWNMWIIGGIFGTILNLFVMGLLVFGLIIMGG